MQCERLLSAWRAGVQWEEVYSRRRRCAVGGEGVQ